MQTWLLYALISMFFAGLTAVVAKSGMKELSSDVALTVRTAVVFGIVILNALLFQNLKTVSQASWKSLTFLCLSGVTTSFSWIFYYKAIKIGNVSEVALIDKGSIIITLLLSFFILKEPFGLKTLLGASLIVSGIAVLTFWK
jgi:bacterial/archaeal transporter family protein